MSDKTPLVEHWDDKLMRDTTNSSSADEEANVDRAAVLLVHKRILGLYDAPNNDLQLFTHIKQYVEITNVVSNTAPKN